MQREFINKAIVAIGVCILLTEAIICIIPQFYSIRDIHQDYLMGLALRQGADPYQPISELWKHYFNTPYKGGLYHPSPHSPIMAVLFAPLSLFPLWFVSLAWYLLSILALWHGIGITLRLFTLNLSLRPGIISLFAISVAGRHELMMGQVNCFIFYLLVLSYKKLKQNQEYLAGIFLGISTVLKFFGWPLFLFLLLSKKWRVTLAAVILTVLCYSTLIQVSGDGILKEYVTRAAPEADKYYAGALSDISLLSLALKLQKNYSAERYSDGRVQVIPPGKEIDKSSYQPRGFSNLIGVSIVVLLVLFALKQNFTTGFNRALILSTIAMPIAWKHYLIPCLFVLVSSWRGYSISKNLSLFILTLPIFFSIDMHVIDLFAFLNPSERFLTIPPWVVAFSILPTFCVIYAAATIVTKEP